MPAILAIINLGKVTSRVRRCRREGPAAKPWESWLRLVCSERAYINCQTRDGGIIPSIYVSGFARSAVPTVVARGKRQSRGKVGYN